MHLFKLTLFCLVVHSAIAQSEYVTLEDGTQIYLVEHGQGPALVFIPGWTMTHRFFEHQQAYFSKDHRVVTYDPRGHGRSDKTQYKNTYADHAHDLRQLLLQKELDDIVLVGWSSGCLTIYEYLRQFGLDRLQKLVFIDEPPKWIGEYENEWVYGDFDDYRGSLKSMISEPSDPNDIIDWMLVQPVDSATRKWMNEEIKLTSAEVALSLFVDGLASDYSAELSHLINIPSLFTVRSSWYPKVAEWMSEKVASAQVVDIPSHASFWEQPEEFNAVLRSFIEREEVEPHPSQNSYAVSRQGDMLLPRYGPTAVTDGKWIYVYGGAPSGGRNGDDFMHAGLHSSIEKIDPNTLKSEYFSGGLHRRANHGAVLFEDKLVSCGGRSQIGLDRPKMAACEYLDLLNGIHREFPALPEALRTLGMTVVDNHIYVIGGLTERNGYSPRTYRLKQNANKWERLQDAPYTFSGQIIAVAKKIYVLGGYNGEAMRKVMVFDTQSLRWEVKADLPYPLSAYSAVADSTSIFIFGDYQQMDAIHRYNISTGKLFLLDQKMTPRRHTASVIVGNEAFVFGGNQTSAGRALTTVEAFSLSELRNQPQTEK